MGNSKPILEDKQETLTAKEAKELLAKGGWLLDGKKITGLGIEKDATLESVICFADGKWRKFEIVGWTDGVTS